MPTSNPLPHSLLDHPLLPTAELDRAVATGLLPWHPLDNAALARAHAALLAHPSWSGSAARAQVRQRLYLDLLADAHDVYPPAAARDMQMLHGNARTTAVVTGQQAGLFTGPLYTVYKAITAIKLARHLEATTGEPVVPIFWNATEDHDLSEIASARLPERDLTAAFPADGRAAEAFAVLPAVADAVDRCLAGLAGSADVDALRALLTLDGEIERVADYGVYSSRLIAHLFRDTGLVVLEPRQLRAAAVPLVQRALREHLALRAALAEGAARLAAVGLPAYFEPGDGTGIFYLAPGETTGEAPGEATGDGDGDVSSPTGRRRQILHIDATSLQVDGRRRDLDEVLAEVEAHPERFSSAAWLRPVWQGLLLPTVAYVGGPGEIRYHQQLRPVFDFFGAPFPVLRLRNHATVLTPRESKLATRLSLSGEALLEPATRWYNRRPLPPEHADEFTDATTGQKMAVQHLRTAIGDLLPEATLGAFETRLRQALERLRQQTHRAWLRRQEIDNARVDRLFAVLRPHGQPQERILNVIYLLEQAGPGLVDALLATFDPLESQHYLIEAGWIPAD